MLPSELNLLYFKRVASSLIYMLLSVLTSALVFVAPIWAIHDLHSNEIKHFSSANMLKSYSFDECLNDLELVLYELYRDMDDGDQDPSFSNLRQYVTSTQDIIYQTINLCSPQLPNEYYLALREEIKRQSLNECHLFDPNVDSQFKDDCFNTLRKLIRYLRISVPDITIDSFDEMQMSAFGEGEGNLRILKKREWKEEEQEKEKEEAFEKLKRRIKSKIKAIVKGTKRIGSKGSHKAVKQKVKDFKDKAMKRTNDDEFESSGSAGECDRVESQYQLHWGHLPGESDDDSNSIEGFEEDCEENDEDEEDDNEDNEDQEDDDDGDDDDEDEDDYCEDYNDNFANNAHIVTSTQGGMPFSYTKEGVQSITTVTSIDMRDFGHPNHRIAMTIHSKQKQKQEEEHEHNSFIEESVIWQGENATSLSTSMINNGLINSSLKFAQDVNITEESGITEIQYNVIWTTTMLAFLFLFLFLGFFL